MSDICTVQMELTAVHGGRRNTCTKFFVVMSKARAARLLSRCRSQYVVERDRKHHQKETHYRHESVANRLRTIDFAVENGYSHESSEMVCVRLVNYYWGDLEQFTRGVRAVFKRLKLASSREIKEILPVTTEFLREKYGNIMPHVIHYTAEYVEELIDATPRQVRLARVAIAQEIKNEVIRQVTEGLCIKLHRQRYIQ